MKSTRKTTGKNRFGISRTYDWINAKSNTKETDVNILVAFLQYFGWI